MGQRGNYIVKTKDKIDIYYTHWRANSIAHDLTLGPNRFLKFIQQFDKKDKLINEPWIEGCVLIDLDSKELLFWEGKQLFDYSLRVNYIQILEKKWTNWNVKFAEKEMYDIEKKLNIDYTSKQDNDFERTDFEKLKSDSFDDYVSCTTIIKRDGNFDLKNLYSITDEQLVLLGKEIIAIIETKPSKSFRKEDDLEAWEIVLIDCDALSLYVNRNITGLKNELLKTWDGWKIEIGNFGYINMLNKAGFDTSDLKMRDEEINSRIGAILNQKDTFNPIEMAEKSVEDDKDVKLHPNFFEDIKPKKSIWERIKSKFID